MSRLIVPLGSRSSADVNIQLVGNKGFNLLKLNRYGFNTAPGFIIPANVLQQMFQQSKTVQTVNSKAANAEPIPDDQSHFSSLPFDSKVTHEIEKFQQKLTGKLAVRSSMIGEDHACASFAGQLDTFLNVEPKALIPSIKHCYASLFKPELQQYISGRETMIVSEETDARAMAVIVQQMVSAKYSGVAFTANPISGRREVVIEASAGIGEKVVSGTINPDRYVVNANSRVEQMIPVNKDQPLLSRRQILLLAESANRITHRMGKPQDIEWAWDGGTFVFLQSRPISSLTGKNIYSSRLMSDMSPGLLKPLQWSTYSLAMVTHVFARLFGEIMGPNDFDFSGSIRLIHSRLYANVTFFESLFQRIGLPVNFFEIITRDETGRRRRPPPTLRLLSVVVFRILPFLLKYSRVRNQMNEFIQKQHAALDRYRKSHWTEDTLSEKHAQLKTLFDLHVNAQWSIIITSLNMSIRNTIMKRMVHRHAPSVEPSDLIKGLASLKGMEPSRELNQLSRQLQSFRGDVIKRCIEGNDQSIREALNTSVDGRQFLADFDGFMQRFGHLSANTTSFTETPWIENPQMIWSMIGMGAGRENISDDIDMDDLRADKKAVVLKELTLLQKPVFRYLLNSTVTYLGLREKISLLLSEDTYQFRRLVLNLGKDLVEKGVVNQADDIFFLYFDELESVLKNTFDDIGLIEKINERRAQLDADRRIVPEDTVCGDEVIHRRREKVNHIEYLTGICGSSGFIQGYAYVVQSPDEVERILTHEDILVVPFTHVGWTPLFPSIGGIVAETGGQLSHTSIIAREYGIPAVVNTPRATRSIKTGQPLTVDADNSRVYLKHIDAMKGS